MERDPATESVPAATSGGRRLLDALTASPAALYPVALATIVLIGLADYATGEEVLLFVLHLIPVALLAWGGGFYAGILGAAAAVAVLFAGYSLVAGEFRQVFVWHGIVSFTGNAVVAWAVSRLKSDGARIASLLAAERKLAREDETTGLASSRAFRERMALEIERMKRSKRPLSLLYMDLDDFKRINDERGHLAGDQTLARVGKLLLAAVRRVDLCARLGGDEFAVLMPETTSEEAFAVAERIRDAIQKPFQEGGASSGASVGLGTFSEAPIDEQAAISLVDSLMYAAKRAGKGGIAAKRFP
jgi:diguanylate cyclase (GGDEF)-like protein